MPKYDCTNDVKAHIALVQKWMKDFVGILQGRASVHDQSKLSNPEEKKMFDEWTPELQKRQAGTPEYAEALRFMGRGLQLHYMANEHHPEHYPNGINGMTLYNLIEMICDWMAVCEAKQIPVDMDYLQERFSIAPQLRSIIENTFKEIDRDVIAQSGTQNLFFYNWKQP